MPNMHSIVKIVRELGNLHSCLAYFTSTSRLPPVVVFYLIFSRNFCRLTFAAATAALSIERKENDLQRVLIISVSAAGAANASAMMNDGQLGVSQLFVVCAESEQRKTIAYAFNASAINQSLRQSISPR